MEVLPDFTFYLTNLPFPVNIVPTFPNQNPLKQDGDPMDAKSLKD